MFYKTSMLAGLMATTVLGHAVHKRDTFGCGAPEPSEALLETARQMSIQEQAVSDAGIKMAQAAVSIPTWFHVVAASRTEADGYVSVSGGPYPCWWSELIVFQDQQLQQQLAVLNENFAPSGFSFTLAGTTRTINANWADDGAELAMKKQLRKGDYGTLNVYFQREIGGNLGYAYLMFLVLIYCKMLKLCHSYCYFPDNVSQGSNDFYYDGCSILSASVPGGSATNYNEGKTTTHEVGHWLGR